MKNGNQESRVPANPLISVSSGRHVGYRDTLDRVADILQLMTEMNLTEGLSDSAETGRYWIELMLIDSVKYVSAGLGSKTIE